MSVITLSDLREDVYSHLDNNTLFYPASDVDNHINESLYTLNLFTGYLQGTVSVSGGTVQNRLIYSVPQEILYPLNIYVSNRQLDRSSLRSVGMKSRTWFRHTTTNFGPLAEWIPIGIDKFALHPKDAIGEHDMEIMGVLAPDRMVADDDVAQLQDSFAEAVVQLAAHTIQLKEGGKVFADSAILYQDFMDKMKELKRFRAEIQPRYWFEVQSEKVA